MATENAAKTQKFKAEVTRVLSLVINSLYSNKEVFLRELISNAADALDKLRFEGIGKPELLPKDHQATIRLIPDAEAGTLTIWDSGIGMNATALAKNLGTVAHSGSKEFIEKLQQAQKENDLQLIGQFGVGFYSAYLVADRVESDRPHRAGEGVEERRGHRPGRLADRRHTPLYGRGVDTVRDVRPALRSDRGRGGGRPRS